MQTILDVKNDIPEVMLNDPQISLNGLTSGDVCNYKYSDVPIVLCKVGNIYDGFYRSINRNTLTECNLLDCTKIEERG